MEQKVFISYRHTAPDQALALHLHNALTQRGARVFLDNQSLKVGMEWAAEIREQIHQCQFFIALISAESIKSDMVRQEIEEASRLNKIILPVRIKDAIPLPYDFAARLDKFHYILWQSDADTPRLQDELWQAMQRGTNTASPTNSSAPNAVTPTGATDPAIPLPVADIFSETGTIKATSPFYVKRDTDTPALRHSQRAGTTTIIKAPRQMGKSSLLARLHHTAREQGLTVCNIDLQFMDNSELENLNTLCQYIAHKIARSVRSREHLSDDNLLGPKEALTNFIEDIVLMETDQPFILILDEVDRVFPYAYRDDFFSLVRAWHNQRAYEALWENFNIVIAHSTEPHLWIQDINQSPFNVGEQLDLHDFTLDQLNWLNHKYGSPLASENELQQLHTLTGGQPYLTRQAFYTLATSGLSLDELDSTADEDKGTFGDHLRRFAWRLSEQPELKSALREIIRQQSCQDENLFLRLRIAGLVRGDIASDVHMRNHLYLRYFRKRL